MAAHQTHPVRTSRVRIKASLFSSPLLRRTLTLTGFGWLFAAALILGLSVTSASASTDLNLGWESGTNVGFSTLECANPSTQFAVVTSPVRDGKYAARISEGPNDVWSNGSVRCLDAAYSTAETTGNDYYFGFSIFIPSQGLTDNLVWELHHPYALYSLPGCGVAPFAILVRNGALQFRTVGGDCVPNVGYSHWEPNIVFPNMNPYPRSQWIDFVVHINFQETNTGLVQVWARTADAAWTTTPQISRTNIPTMPFSSANNVHNVKLYTEMGLYPGYSGYQSNDTIYLDAYRRGTTFTDVAPGGTSSSPPATTTTTQSTTTAPPPTTTTTATTTTAPAPTTTTTTTTTTDAAPVKGNNGNGKGGGKHPDASGTAVRLLASAATAPKISAAPGVKVLSVLVHARNAEGVRVSLIDKSKRRIPLLKHTRIGAIETTYWRKTLSIGKLRNGRVTLHLRVNRASLRNATSLRLRVVTLVPGRTLRPVYLPVHA